MEHETLNKKQQNNKMDIKDWFISNFKLFENTLNGSSLLPIHSIRKKAINYFSEVGFPTLKNEEWKYTSLDSLAQHKFELSKTYAEISENEIRKYRLQKENACLLVFINGHFCENLSNTNSLPDNIAVENIHSLLNKESSVINNHLTKYANYKSNAFTALNTAFLQDGAYINIPDNTQMEQPIQLLFLSDPTNFSFITHPRNLIIIGKNSGVSIIETYHHLSANTYFNNIVTEIVVNENANLKHYRIQAENQASFNINTTEVNLKKGGTYSSYAFDVGGAIVRNNLNVMLNEQHSEANLYGLYLTEGKQHIDNHTLIDHCFPDCTSNELYKGILNDKSRGVFNGKVFVRKDAQHTNAFQENKNLLLSKDAVINTKPQLEIFADDVKCSHGATIGKLDEDALFYLRSRGIGLKEAESILQLAFAADIIEKVSLEPLRKMINELMLNRFKNN